VWEFGMLLLLIGAIALIAGPWIMRRRGMRGGPGGMAQGNLVVTGVSPRPDETGRQFVTITGVINGPTVNEHVVYQRLEVDVNDWPTMGQLFPVVYAPNNPDKWAFAPSAEPPPGSGPSMNPPPYS
jgi:hypothetical protein